MKKSMLKKLAICSVLATSIAIGGFFGFKKIDEMKRENAVKNSSLYSYVMSKKPLEEERYIITNKYRGSEDTQIVIIDTSGAREWIFRCFRDDPKALAEFETLTTDRKKDSLILNVVATTLNKKYVTPTDDMLDKLLYTKKVLRPNDIFGGPVACYTVSVAVAGVASTLGVPSQLFRIDNIDHPYHSVLMLDGSCAGLVVDIAGPEYGQPLVVDTHKFFTYDCWGIGFREGFYILQKEKKIK
jgi:hypothetical protein